METETTLLDALAAALRRAGSYNPNDLAPPAAVLWPDQERQWEPLLPELRQRLPLLTLGPYDPETGTGPAYWLRCVIDRALAIAQLPDEALPIIYLPGLSRADLRAVEECPILLQPLAELQYRGCFWSHPNGRDWTIAAYLQNSADGLGIAVEGDQRTRAALKRALRKLASEPVAALCRQQPIRADYLDQLLNPDEIVRLLRWLTDPVAERGRLTPEEWDAFVSVCRRTYGFDPERDGVVTAARKLGERQGAWRAVWDRFAEAPRLYPEMPELLAKAQPPRPLTMFEIEAPWPGREDPQSSWPGLNQAQEEIVRGRLRELRQRTPDEARAILRDLERAHGARRDWIWTELGHSPLANALRPLATLAELTGRPLVGGTVNDLAQAYAGDGWRTDAAALDALAAVKLAPAPDLQAVQIALSAVYRPWLEETALRFQEIVGAGDGYVSATLPTAEDGTCFLFCDGLRYDIGQRLATALTAANLTCAASWHLAALPTVTPTAKPAVSPVAAQLTGGSGFDPKVAASGRAVNISVLRQLLADDGYHVLRGDELGEPDGRAWTEMGAIDEYGHNEGWRVAYHALEEVERLTQRIAALIEHGWRRIIVVTDHGWLMLPDELPKAELPEHLTEKRKGRCARLKPGAEVDVQWVPWRWDATVRMAVAPGISCFEAGRAYEHGGLSPQECVVPVLTVTIGQQAAGPVVITRVTWRGLRCNITLTGSGETMTVDLRRRPIDPSTSIAHAAKHPDPDGTLALFVEDDELIGADAEIVVLAANGAILAQQTTRVGGDG